MADYQYDIFISYRRMDEDWVRWTRENFVRPLRSLLRPALGNIQIFLDEQVETGVSWPAHLASAHARSRLLIPLLSRDYFNSDWCRLELALMFEREKKLGYRTPLKPSVLILPLVIDDGTSFPAEVQNMQGKDIHPFANPWIRIDSTKQEKFTEDIRIWAPRVEDAISSIPPFDPLWETLTHEQFTEMFRIKVAAQKTLPSLSLFPLEPPPSESGASSQ